MKRSLPSKTYQEVQRALHQLHDEALLSDEAFERAQHYYTEKNKVSPITALLATGGILIGIGFIALVSSFWSTFSIPFKFFILFASTLTLFTSGFIVEKRYFKTGRSLWYAGSLAFGASVFFIQSFFQPFYFEPYNVLLIVTGLLPLLYFLKDRLMTIVSLFILMITSFNLYANPSLLIIFFGLLLTLSVTYINEKRNESSSFIFGLQMLTLSSWLLSLLETLDIPNAIQALLFVLIALLLLFAPFRLHQEVVRWVSTILLLFASIALTIPATWEQQLFTDGSTAALIWTVLFSILLLYALRNYTLQAIVLIGALVFRLYVDYTYELIPKSAFFIIAGVLLLTIGFLFERAYKKGERHHEQ